MREIRVVDLYRRDVDRDGQGSGPGRRLAARRPQHPFANLENDAALLRHRDEFGGWNFAPRRMLPAQQSLEADDLAVTDVLLGLVDEPQLSSGNRVA